MNLIEIDSLTYPGVEVYSSLTEAQLRNRLNQEPALFIAESPKVIKVAMDKGFMPCSMLCEKKHVEGDAAEILSRCPADFPVYTGGRDLLAALTGYKLTRGVLCAMRWPKLPAVGAVCKDARRVAVIQGVTDTTNIGAIFRSAAALGWDAVLLTPDSCDPLNRRSVRVSMGSVFLVPWTYIDFSLDELKRIGFKTAAMALTDRSVSVDDARVMSEKKLAIILGTEGDGLPREAIERADYTIKIPMCHNVDSLNVAAAAAVAFWQLR